MDFLSSWIDGVVPTSKF